jgi:hypothetical protein
LTNVVDVDFEVAGCRERRDVSKRMYLVELSRIHEHESRRASRDRERAKGIKIEKRKCVCGIRVFVDIPV